MNTKSQYSLNTHASGVDGENKACLYLNVNNYVIIERNWRTKQGEIDIIALDGDVLVFAEVKKIQNGTIDTLSHILGKTKQKRIVETAKCFLQKYRQYSNSLIRFDVLVIDMPEFEAVHHIINAFSEQV
jgi:putative endonuclease